VQSSRTTFRVWLRNHRAELPAAIWHGVPVVSERWYGTGCLEVDINGDGADLKQLLERRADVFSFEPLVDAFSLTAATEVVEVRFPLEMEEEATEAFDGREPILAS
jgi:hypothetical protein